MVTAAAPLPRRDDRAPGFLTLTTVAGNLSAPAEGVAVQRLAGIEARAGDDPEGLAMADDAGELTWAQVAGQVDAVAGELLAVAPGADDRVAVMGENVAPTLMTHAAAILAGVGTVAVSRQLTAEEMADQFRDAGVVAVVTGPAGLAAAVDAAR